LATGPLQGYRGRAWHRADIDRASASCIDRDARDQSPDAGRQEDHDQNDRKAVHREIDLLQEAQPFGAGRSAGSCRALRQKRTGAPKQDHRQKLDRARKVEVVRADISETGRGTTHHRCRRAPRLSVKAMTLTRSVSMPGDFRRQFVSRMARIARPVRVCGNHHYEVHGRVKRRQCTAKGMRGRRRNASRTRTGRRDPGDAVGAWVTPDQFTKTRLNICWKLM